MNDLISRQEALDALEWKWAGKAAIDAIKNLPSAQPERKKGEWIWCGNHHICSECDEWALTRWDEDKCDEVDILTDFCPNCGADMRGEQDE